MSSAGRNVYGPFAPRPWGETSMDESPWGEMFIRGAKHPWGTVCGAKSPDRCMRGRMRAKMHGIWKGQGRVTEKQRMEALMPSSRVKRVQLDQV